MKDTLKTALLISSLATGLSVAVALPSPAASGALTAADGPDGGHLLSGPLTGVSSGPAAFKAGLHRMRPYFADTRLAGAIHTKDGDTTIAAFQATEHGQPVAGLAVASYDPAGHSRFAVLFDEPDHLAQSLPPMIDQLKAITNAALEKDRPAGGDDARPDFAGYEAAAKHVPLTRTSFPDGTATIGIADGFNAVIMNGGHFGATAQDGAYINLNNPAAFLDPSSSGYQSELRINGGRPPNFPGQTVLAYDPDPVHAWRKMLAVQAERQGNPDPDPHVLLEKPASDLGPGVTGKIVGGTMTLHGEAYVFSGRLVGGMRPSAEGLWTVQLSIRAAPLAHAAHDMPALIAMQNSEKVNVAAVGEEGRRQLEAANAATSAALSANHAAGLAQLDDSFNRSMHNAEVSEDNMTRTSAGFIHYLNDQTVVEHGPTNSHGTLGSGVADALVKSDPQHFSVVPISQYVKGVDY